MWPGFAEIVLVIASTGASAGVPIPRVVIVEQVDLPSDLRDFQPGIRSAAETAVKEKGWSVTRVRSGGQGQCESAAGLDEIAREEAGAYVLCVGGVYRSGHYDLDVRLWKVGVGWTTRQSEPVGCPRCTVPQLIDHVGAWTRTLVSAEVQRVATESSVAVAPPPALHAPVIASRSPNGQSSHGLSIGLVAGGALAVAGGGVLWWAHGRDLDCENGPAGQRVCPRRLDTRAASVSLVAVGIVAASWGILRWRFGDSSMALGVGSGNVSLAGRF